MSEPTEPKLDSASLREKDIERIRTGIKLLKDSVIWVESLLTDETLVKKNDLMLDALGDGIEQARNELNTGAMIAGLK
ncbi:MAG: hypothetical protein AAB638_02470 [Patescibacteria group bacterium]